MKRWLRKFDWHITRLPGVDNRTILVLSFIWMLAMWGPAASSAWWVYFVSLPVAASLTLLVICDRTNAIPLKPWSLWVGTEMRSGELLDPFDPSPALIYLQSNFRRSDYILITPTRVMFRTRQQAIMFKLAQGGKRA